MNFRKKIEDLNRKNKIELIFLIQNFFIGFVRAFKIVFPKLF